MATLQGYRIQALTIAMAWHNKGYVPAEIDLLELADKIYKFITKDVTAPENFHYTTINGELFCVMNDGSYIKLKEQNDR